jgi:hypothetical protein
MRMSATWLAARAVPSAFISMRPTVVLTSVSWISPPTKAAAVTSSLLSTLRSRCFASVALSPMATSTPHPLPPLFTIVG